MTAFLGTPWTPAEDEVIRERYRTGGVAAVRSALPERTTISIYKRARRIGVLCNPRWSADDDQRLRVRWGTETLEETARALGRTPLTTYWRVQRLGLPLGVPQGHEYLTAAGARLGYTTTQLRRILRAGGVQIHRTLARPGKPTSYHFVDSHDATAAVEAWLRTVPIEAVAREHGVSGEFVRTCLAELGVKPPRKARGSRKHWRVDVELVERALSARIETETVMAAAKRVGAWRTTLAGWLEEAGIPRGPGRVWRVRRADVDAVVAAKRSRRKAA